ncbi:hypothetical protein LTR84_007402 [Exophiala bonariae]|uniref:DUF171-domain-containing protein n=1 Tax=Exophiala bonariae TaxID=1690606 RepID=A0AAV9N1V5_9EURO|nr:hypothetical protein LTR84_007402 [Exophiala bonariae]
MAKDKKRKRDAGDVKPGGQSQQVDTSKPTAVFQPSGGRAHTLSVALPGSIIANAKSHDQKTYLAGQIARALAVFCVDEVVVFDDEDKQTQHTRHAIGENDYTAFSHPCHFLAHLLSYLETPPHLRKTLFPMHPNLRTAGTLPSLDMPHHLRANEWCEYREGVVLKSDASGSSIDVGLAEPRVVEGAEIPQGTRVTLRLGEPSSTTAEAVAPSTPREETGYYWGFNVRSCKSLSTVFTECPFDGGYNVSFGTSERGEALPTVLTQPALAQPEVQKYRHVLVAFGGVAGLETAGKNDLDLGLMGISGANVQELFDHWVNVLPNQGSRTIRTEEAIWLGLMGLRGFVEQIGR